MWVHVPVDVHEGTSHWRFLPNHFPVCVLSTQQATLWDV